MTTRADELRTARTLLRECRELTKHARARRTTARIRAAISSINGAIRHAEMDAWRAARPAGYWDNVITGGFEG